MALSPAHSSQSTSAKYSPEWFSVGLRRGLDSPRRVVPLLMDLVHPTSVVDVGCGPGSWLAAFHDHGVTDTLGVDGEWLDESVLQVSPDRILLKDLSEPLDLPRRFDLVLSLEVAEHLPVASAPTFVASLTRAGRVVAFSAAVPFQGGSYHVNERWPDHWASLFQEHGFVAVDGVRQRLWLDESVAWYYRQNLVIFAERDALTDYPELQAQHEQYGGELLPLVHPDRYARLASASALRLREGAAHWVADKLPRTMRLLTRLRSRGT